VLVLCCLLWEVYYIFTRNSSIQNAFPFLRNQRKMRLRPPGCARPVLSKQVSPFDIKSANNPGRSFLGRPGAFRSQVKTVAGAMAQDTSASKTAQQSSVNPSIERNPDRSTSANAWRILEIKTLVADALSKNAELAEKNTSHRSEGSSGDTRRNGADRSVRKNTATKIAWQVPGVQGLTDNLSLSDTQAMPESADR